MLIKILNEFIVTSGAKKKFLIFSLYFANIVNAAILVAILTNVISINNGPVITYGVPFKPDVYSTGKVNIITVAINIIPIIIPNSTFDSFGFLPSHSFINFN